MSFSYVPLRQPNGVVTGMVSLVQDITVQRDEEKRLLNLAERDALTGVLNRAGFNRYLQDRYQQNGAALALLYGDLDRFKPVNDLHGHHVGDELLRIFRNTPSISCQADRCSGTTGRRRVCGGAQ